MDSDVKNLLASHSDTTFIEVYGGRVKIILFGEVCPKDMKVV